ncbi:sensor histidine kinase [Brevundimonas sp.]|uniref:sensor histidine kinase n=1 Tax=Brevundimonas sp. TaxID=1871086 RepID=UPI0028A01B4F|nr:sensor histidine kinase [Brevundimonas sp.]
MSPAEPPTAAPLEPSLRFLAGGGAATQLILDRDWSDHPLGPPQDWPSALKTALSLVLNSPESMILAWGEKDLWFFFNETYFPLLGPRLGWAMGSAFIEVWADGWEQAKPIIDEAFAGRSRRFIDLPWKLAADRGLADTWWTFSYSRVLNAEGGIDGLFIFTNETTSRVLADAARLQAEDHNAILAAETTHRLKNTLAMVQAIGRQSLKGLDRDRIQVFEDRLMALGAAHSALTEQNWQSADLSVLVSNALANVLPGESFSLNGPAFSVSDRSAQSITMLMHEMATNALKHGAASTPNGRVEIDWRLDGDHVVLNWREVGGPAAEPPARRGFGSKLIERGLFGTGGADVRYTPQGLLATFTACADRLAPGSQPS